MSTVPIPEPTEYFETLMLDCLQMHNFNKRLAVDAFVKKNKNAEWTRAYAHRIYNKVMKAMGSGTVLQMMATEVMGNLMTAAEVALQDAIESKDFTQFLGVTSLQIKAAGLEKQAIHNNVHMIGGVSIDATRERLEQLRSKFIGGTVASGGTGGYIEGKPVIDLPVPSKTTVSTPEPS